MLREDYSENIHKKKELAGMEEAIRGCPFVDEVLLQQDKNSKVRAYIKANEKNLFETEETSSNKRETLRYAFRREGILKTATGDKVNIRIKNITSRGFGFEGSTSIQEKGSKVSISLIQGEKQIIFTGKIAWQKEDAGGITLSPPLPAPLNRLFDKKYLQYSRTEKIIKKKLSSLLGEKKLPDKIILVDHLPLTGEGEPDVIKLKKVEQFNRALMRLWKKNITSGVDDRDLVELLNKLPPGVKKKLPVTDILLPTHTEKGEELSPLTHPQKRIWFSEISFPGSGIGNLFHSVVFSGEVDFERLTGAIKQTVRKERIFHTRLKEVRGNIMQYLEEYEEFKIPHFPGHTNLDQFRRWLKQKTLTPLLENEVPLFHFSTHLFPGGQGGFLFGIHHILADEATVALIIEEIKNAYLGQKLEIESYSYIRFMEWEKAYLQSEEFQKDREFWLTRLGDYNEPAHWKSQPPKGSFKARRLFFTIPMGLRQEVEEYCATRKTSLFRIFLTAIYLCLYRITGRKDIVIGSAMHNRFREGQEDVKGMLVSTTPIRLNPGDEISLTGFLDYLKKEMALIKEHQAYPFDLLLKDLQEKGMEPTPLFEVVLNYHNMAFPLKTEWHFQEAQSFPLVINLSHRGQGLSLEIDWLTALFEEEEIRRFKVYLFTILQNLKEDEEENLFAREIVPPEEKKKLLHKFNDTHHDYPVTTPYHHLFQSQADRTPDRQAVVFRDQIITYKELDQKTNSLARALRKKGIGRDRLTGILTPNTPELIFGALGVLKAGGAYVPIDPGYPSDRIDYTLENSDAPVLLTLKGLEKKAPAFKGIVLFLDDPDLYKEENTNPGYESYPEDLAYVIYTSGTTGKPKGVMIEHHSLVNLCFWNNRVYKVTENDRATKYASVGFDASVWEIFPYLMAGASIHIFEEENKYDIDRIHQFFVKNNITISFLPTPMCEEFMKEDKHCPSLRVLNTGGDKINFFKRGSFQLSNNYGPTEATVVSTHFFVNHYYKNIPIGRPLDNTEIYILNKENRLQPLGTPGELCISGESLSRGYYKQPEKTDLAFVPNPFRPGKKMYRTGDMVRWLPNGNIEFLGRLDFQVKIRGFRIELEEIRKNLIRLENIKDAVVLVKEDQGKKELAAYIIEKGFSAVSFSFIREELKKVLPIYMVPTLFARINYFPLNTHGKLDRKKMLFIATTRAEDVNFQKPANALEEEIAEIWKDLLGIKQVSTTANFFEAGGNSLTVIDLSTKLKEKFDIHIPVVQLFDLPTIKKQVDWLLKKNRNIKEKVEVTVPGETTDIAVIGIAGRFPGARNIYQFWNNLVDGKESITFFTDDELAEEGVAPELLEDPSYVKAKGIIEGINFFDAPFFGYTQNDAVYMDPQLRIFHEVVYEGLENAGYIPGRYEGKIGLFAGASDNFIWQESVYQGTKNFAQKFPRMILNKDFIATRVAYKLNLHGPAYTVQTACSTSLVAVDMAVESLLRGDCDIALAGGVSLFLPQRRGYFFKEGFTLSPDGHCRAFDADAGGMLVGEGAGVTVLKPLRQALKDKDHIWGIIKGSATNNDGIDKIGYTAPSISGQSDVIRQAMKRAGVVPESITYIESHGTGTSLGDPVEFEGLKSAFNTSKKQFCRIGAVKTNIGHLDSAAGIAGFIKAVLSLYHKQLPPTLHYKRPNPKIDFKDSPFLINDRLTQWHKPSDYPRRAGVSAFGIGGTNAHVILEEAPETEKETVQEAFLFLLSAREEELLEQKSRELADFIREHIELLPGDIAFTLIRGRDFFEYRKAFVCSSREEALEYLEGKREAITRKTEKKESRNDPQLFSRLKNELTPELLILIGELWVQDVELPWDAMPFKGHRVPLPSYPFARHDFPVNQILKEMGLDESLKDFKKSTPDHWFYLPQWEQTASPDSSGIYNYLIFPDPWNIGRELAEELTRKGHRVEIAKPENLKTLFRDLDFDPQRIIYLSALGKRFVPGIEPEDYHNLLEIARLRDRKKTLIINITNNLFDTGNNPRINYFHAFSRGAVKNIPLEFPAISCLHLDILYPETPLKFHSLINQLFEEVTRKSMSTEDTIAFRELQRLELHYYPGKGNYTDKGRKMIKKGGTYLITGALGGMGYTLAEELASQYNASLILITGRTPFPAQAQWQQILAGKDEKLKEKINMVMRLKSKGARILPLGGDISREDEIRKIFEEFSLSFSDLNGIFHCAGVPDGRMIANRDPLADKAVMAPKVDGSLLLARMSEKFNLDFFIHCSSLTSVLGTLGQTGYAAANAFQDAFAAYYRKEYGLPMIAINWDSWKDLGMGSALQKRLKTMSLKSIRNKELVKAYLEHGLTPGEGLECFYNALGMNMAQVLVSTLPAGGEGVKAVNKELILLLTRGEDSLLEEGSRTGNSGKEFLTLEEITAECVRIWQNHLGCETLRPEDNYFDLGGDSLGAIQIVPELNKTFRTNLSVNSFLELDTVKALAGEIFRSRDKEKEKESRLILSLKKSDSLEPPLFLIHPVSGTVYFYQQLCRVFPGERKVYGIQARGLEDGNFIPDLKDMAALYVKNVLEIQPRGPYWLGGSSMGGCVAYEMALQLQEAGKEIGGIIMLDTPGPGAKVPSFQDHEEVLAYFLSYNNDDTTGEVLSWLYALPEDAKYYYFLRQQSDYSKLLDTEQSVATLKRSIEITLINSLSMDEYYRDLKTSFKGKVLYFSALKESRIPVNLEEGWKELVPGGMEIHKVEGNHITINFEPNVKFIGEKIAAFMEKHR